MVWGATCVRMAVACAHARPQYGRAVVEEVRGATEGESIVSGLFPEEFEEIDRLTVGEDVQQAQKLRRNSPWMRPEVESWLV